MAKHLWKKETKIFPGVKYPKTKPQKTQQKRSKKHEFIIKKYCTNKEISHSEQESTESKNSTESDPSRLWVSKLDHKQTYFIFCNIWRNKGRTKTMTKEYQ